MVNGTQTALKEVVHKGLKEIEKNVIQSWRKRDSFHTMAEYLTKTLNYGNTENRKCTS